MAFTINDMRDLTQLLALHPEWRAEVRRLVLSDELLTLPELVHELAGAQKRTEQRVEELVQAQARTEQRVEELVQAQARTEQRVEELAQAQARTEQRLERLEATMQQLAEAQRDVERQLTELVEAQNRTERAVTRLTEGLQKANDKIGELLGWRLERQYHDRVSAFFGRWLRPVEAIPVGDLREALEGRLDEEAIEDIMRLDVLLRGRARHAPGNPEVWLAIEVSNAVDRADVERAQRRAALLRKAGYRAIPAVGGEWLTDSAEKEAHGVPILILEDGRARGWEEALAAAQ